MEHPLESHRLIINSEVSSVLDLHLVCVTAALNISSFFLADMSPANCEKFLAADGIDLFLDCCYVSSLTATAILVDSRT